MTTREDEIRGRAKKALAGPWYVTQEKGHGPWFHMAILEGTGRDTAQFIAHAREDIPYLLAQLDHSEGQLADARGQLAVAREEIERLRTDAIESDALRMKMADILSRTAINLKCKPTPTSMCSWHDLPEVTEQLRDSIRIIGIIFGKNVTYLDTSVLIPFESHDQAMNHWNEAREAIVAILRKSP